MLPLQHFNDTILRKDGIEYNAKGSNKPKAKLDKKLIIKAFCVFLYTAQKQVIAYQ